MIKLIKKMEETTETKNNQGVIQKLKSLFQKKITKDKAIYIIIIAIIIIAIIEGGIYWYMQKQSNPVSVSDSNTPADAGTPNDTAKPDSSSPATKSPPASSSLSYAEALKIYANRRIQFSVNSSNYCTMNPSFVSFKKGTNVMFDNRANKQITIYLDGKPYYIKAYGFKIITLTTSAKLPHTVKVDCGTGKNNGSILLQ